MCLFLPSFFFVGAKQSIERNRERREYPEQGEGQRCSSFFRWENEKLFWTEKSGSNESRWISVSRTHTHTSTETETLIPQNLQILNRTHWYIRTIIHCKFFMVSALGPMESSIHFFLLDKDIFLSFCFWFI